MKKRVSTALTWAILLSLLASCDAGEPAESDTTPTETTPAVMEEVETEAPDTRVRDDLPADLDLGGATVSFLYREEVAGEFCSEDIVGEIVNDALFNSHLAVESRLNADINEILMLGHNVDVRATYMNNIRQSINAQDGLYDWVDLMIGNSTVLMGEGMFRNIADNPYIDPAKPWYLAGTMEQTAIDGKLYFISGDASLGYLKSTYCMYYNMTVAEDYQVGDLYELVHAGEWTVDKVREIAALAKNDTDGSGTYDLNDDLGFVLHDFYQFIGFLGSCNASLYTKNTDGVWEFSFGSDRDVSIADTLYRFCHETDGVYMSKNTELGDPTEYMSISNKFVAGDILLISAEMDDITVKLRDIQDPYGVLPYPKYSVDQADYTNIARSIQNAFSMPVTCANPDNAGAVLEALSCENYNTVLPAYFETAMKTKYSENNETAKMFDLVKNSTNLTFWYTYNNALGDPVNKIYFPATITAKSDGTLASLIAANKTSLATAVEEYQAKVAELDG